MKNEQRPVTREIEQLMKKAAEANTVIISETARFISRLAKSEVKPGEMAMVRKKLFRDAINGLIKLNLQYTSSLIDMGVAISKSINQHFAPAEEPLNTEGGADTKETGPEERTFVLRTSAGAGSTAGTVFLLHSDKRETVQCTILHSGFIDEADGQTLLAATVLFNPQTFALSYGNTQRIDVNIETAQDARPGLYRSHISIQGFEHTQLDILLQVLPAKPVALADEVPIETNKPADKKPARATTKKKGQKGNTRSG